jgi:integrase
LGRRRRPRVGTDRDEAKLLAAEVNAQLEAGAPSGLSFERVTMSELRRRWLDHHENVRRSSVHTIRRYRAATDHLLRFVDKVRPARDASAFGASHAEEFVAYLRSIKVSPNGHPKTRKRRLLDKGVGFIAEACRAMFGHASRHRHLSPYGANPFAAIEIDRMPVDDAKPVVLFTADQEGQFLRACDDWQFPMFLTLILTGLRPGELSHLLLPDDLDLADGVLRVRNKPDLGWQVKTRSERAIPVVPILGEALRAMIGGRVTGPVFLRREFHGSGSAPTLSDRTELEIVGELGDRVSDEEHRLGRQAGRAEILRLARYVWRDAGAITPKRVRSEFIQVAKTIGMPEQTSPKMLRHLFATSLQEGNVDWLIRMEVMGHSPGRSSRGDSREMTSRYTHTRDETRRKQLAEALKDRPAVRVARERVLDAQAASRPVLVKPSSSTRRSSAATSSGHSRSTAAS